MASELGTLTAGLEKPNIDTMANYYLGNLIKAQRTIKRTCTHVGKRDLTYSKYTVCSTYFLEPRVLLILANSLVL